MASEHATRAADAALMAYTASQEGSGEAVLTAILNVYGDELQDGEAAGRALAGHIELQLLLLAELVKAKHKPADKLLRRALGE